jgi:hypothetical protein
MGLDFFRRCKGGAARSFEVGISLSWVLIA